MKKLNNSITCSAHTHTHKRTNIGKVLQILTMTSVPGGPHGAQCGTDALVVASGDKKLCSCYAAEQFSLFEDP